VKADLGQVSCPNSLLTKVKADLGQVSCPNSLLTKVKADLGQVSCPNSLLTKVKADLGQVSCPNSLLTKVKADLGQAWKPEPVGIEIVWVREALVPTPAPGRVRGQRRGGLRDAGRGVRGVGCGVRAGSGAKR